MFVFDKFPDKGTVSSISSLGTKIAKLTQHQILNKLTCRRLQLILGSRTYSYNSDKTAIAHPRNIVHPPNIAGWREERYMSHYSASVRHPLDARMQRHCWHSHRPADQSRIENATWIRRIKIELLQEMTYMPPDYVGGK